jgi:transcriptional regulator with XRE-family HTH domain
MASDPYSSPLAYFAEELKRLRKRNGMTQGDVAKETNYALSTVSAYETGHLIPPSDFAKRADKLFGTDGRQRRRPYAATAFGRADISAPVVP